jgi:hypothetical protein
MNRVRGWFAHREWIEFIIAMLVVGYVSSTTHSKVVRRNHSCQKIGAGPAENALTSIFK